MNPGPVTSAEILLFLALCVICCVVWLFRKGVEHAKREPDPATVKATPCTGCGATPQQLFQVPSYDGRWCQECVFVGAHHRTKG